MNCEKATRQHLYTYVAWAPNGKNLICKHCGHVLVKEKEEIRVTNREKAIELLKAEFKKDPNIDYYNTNPKYLIPCVNVLEEMIKNK